MSFNFPKSDKIFKMVEKYNCSFMKTHKKRTDVKYLVLFPREIKQQICIGLLILALNKSFVSGIFGIVSQVPVLLPTRWRKFLSLLSYDCHFVLERPTSLSNL